MCIRDRTTVDGVKLYPELAWGNAPSTINGQMCIRDRSQQVLKAANGDVNKGHIAEEIADVEIMLEQIKMIFDRHVSVEAQVDYKLDRLQQRIEVATNANNR